MLNPLIPQLYIFVNKIINFVDLVPDYGCSRLSSAGWCKKKIKYSQIFWSQVCALACGDEELCPNGSEENPSEQLPGEFHNLILMSSTFTRGMPLKIN